MERYVFDCRQNFQETPQFLKRNKSLKKYKKDQSLHHNYLKNKVFVTFDYSYYQNIIPKTSSCHHQKLNNLSSLLTPKNHEKSSSKQLQFFNDQKWKKQGQDHHSRNKTKNFNTRSNSSKIKGSFISHPGIGDYDVETNLTRKRIVKDIIIRGKPKDSTHQQCNTRKDKNKQNTKEKGRSKVQAKSQIVWSNEKKGNLQKSKEDEQFWKFIDSIDVKTVWKNLGKKHKFKGIKLDFME